MALLCLAPVAVIPGGENRFVFGKLALFAAGVVAASLAVPRGRLPRPVAWLLLAGIAVTGLSAALGSNPLNAAAGAAPRYEGLPVLALYAACGWAGARLLGPLASREAIRALEWSLSITAVAVGFIAVLETAGLRPLSSNLARPGSLLGNASDEGALGVLIAGTLGWIVLRRGIVARADPGHRDSVVALVGACAASAVVALSASRAALLGLAVAAAILFLTSPAGRRMALVGALALIAVLTLIAPGARTRVIGSSPLATATVHGRFLLWQETIGLIGRHPAIGIGPGTYLDAITSEHDLRWQQQVGPANPPDSSHDWVLQAASVGGVALLLIAGATCVLTARAGRRLIRSGPDPSSIDDARASSLGIGAFAGLAGYGVALLFGFTTPGTTPLAAALGGVVLAQSPAAKTGLARLHEAARWSAATGAASLVVLAIMGSFAEIQLRNALGSAAAGDVAAAGSRFETASTLRPWDPSIDEIAGHAFVVVAQSDTGASQQEATGSAARWVGRARRRLPNDEQVRLDAAAVSELRSEYAQSETLLKAVLAHDRDNPAVLLSLGVVEGESGALPQAASTLVQVTRIDPTSPDPWKDLAIVYRLEGRQDLAAQAAARAHRLLR